MVSGVVSHIHGEIAIFSTGRHSHDQTTKHGQYQFLCRVINDPYDMLGCWCDRNFFLCGAIQNLPGQRSSTTIWLCDSTAQNENNSTSITVNAFKRALFKLRNQLQLTIYARFLHVFSRNKLLELPNAWDDSTRLLKTTTQRNHAAGDDSGELHLFRQEIIFTGFF